MNPKLQHFFQLCKEKVEARMPAIINDLQAPQILKDSMLYSINAGGKRIRPILLFATIESFSRDMDIGTDVASALEMIHTYSLIHDDLPAMDNDDFRRGKPTNHKVFGDAMAILAGDGLLTLSFEVISNISHPDITSDMKIELIRMIAKAAGPEGMVGGQVADIDGEGKTLTVDELVYIHRHKTGDLLTFAVESGAVLSRVDDKTRRTLKNFAQELGLVFQIKDDILDIEGDEKKLGKPVGSDIAKAKNTYPSLLTLEGAKQKLNEHAVKAKQYLREIGLEHSLLHSITDYIVTRDH